MTTPVLTVADNRLSVRGRGGTVDLGAPLVGIGLDGTAFAARNQRTFRIYPQLFR